MKKIKNLLIMALLILANSIQAQESKIFNLKRQWKFTIGDREEYQLIDYDDSDWESIYAPSPWENQGFPNFNGFAWYRFSFDGKDLIEKENLSIKLGYIDDVHEVYLNEELIGFKGSFPPDFYTAYDAFVSYNIPKGLLDTNGKNTIAIKVYDLYREGGIVKGDLGIYYKPDLNKDMLNLEGVWRFTTKPEKNWNEPYFDDSEWDNIVVPSFWKSKRIKRSVDYGWYRTEFKLPEYLKNTDVYVIVGYIDDFDKTYVNGQLIGETNDRLPFGWSTSFEKLRAYRVSKEVLSQNGTNTLAVEVQDIGIDAGIYKGPIGIIPAN